MNDCITEAQCARMFMCAYTREHMHSPVSGALSDFVPPPDLRAASDAVAVAPPDVLAAYNCAQVALLSTKTKKKYHDYK